MIEAVFSEKINTLTVVGLTQWDRGRTLHIRGLDLPPLTQVHFADKINTEALCVASTQEVDGSLAVNIPNVMLETTHDIYAWVYLTDEELGKTVKTIILKVEKRAKPQDYDYEDPKVDDALSNILDYIRKYSAIPLTEPDIDEILAENYHEDEDLPPVEIEDGEPIDFDELDKITDTEDLPGDEVINGEPIEFEELDRITED